MGAKTVWLSPQQVEDQTTISVDQLKQWRHRKIGIPFHKPSPRKVLYDQADVDEYIRNRRVQTKESAA